MGIDVKFELNDGWEQQFNLAIKDGMDELCRDYTQLIDSVGQRYRGRPVDEIKPVLQSEWSQINGGTLDEPELSEFAQAISDGVPIEFKNGGLQS